jgi:Cd2+/Zn2+-exporting ATPase
MEKETIDIQFQVKGIMCSGCALDMENILQDIDGIEDAAVNFTDGIIAITFNPVEIDEKTLTARVRKLGFKITKM